MINPIAAYPLAKALRDAREAPSPVRRPREMDTTNTKARRGPSALRRSLAHLIGFVPNRGRPQH